MKARILVFPDDDEGLAFISAEPAEGSEVAGAVRNTNVPQSVKYMHVSYYTTRAYVMDVPPEIAFRDIEPLDSLKAEILEGIDKLEKVHPHLVSCRTMVADETPARRSGANYRVRLEIGIPGRTLVVDERDPDPTGPRTLNQTITDAFDVARKRLKEAKERQRGQVKTHDLPPHGRVTRLLEDDTGVRYGFLESRDGRSIYFHEDALVDLDYDDLEVGDEVRFAEAGGDEGPQASSVVRLDLGDIGPVRQRSLPLQDPSRDPESGR